MPEDIYLEVQAVLLNSEGDPRKVAADALRAVLEFADGEGVRDALVFAALDATVELPTRESEQGVAPEPDAQLLPDSKPRT